jgi:enterochelin esterase-like enzyme
MKFLTASMLLVNVIFAPAQTPLPRPAHGKIERLVFDSKLVDDRNVDVWLPDDYSTDKKYAVLYMHDGQMLYDSAITWNKQEWRVDETLSGLMKSGKVKNTIVVGIWNNGDKRPAEYFPQKALAMIPDGKLNELKERFQGEALADRYLQFIVQELKPYIDQKFSTHRDFQHTFICGSSMGGLISMYAICEYPNVFSGAACLSTHWIGIFSANEEIPNALIQYLEKNLPSPKSHKIYFDYGTETLDALYPPHQKKADALMKRKNFSTSKWQTRAFNGADHSEKAWAERLHIPLEFLLAK